MKFFFQYFSHLGSNSGRIISAEPRPKKKKKKNWWSNLVLTYQSTDFGVVVATVTFYDPILIESKWKTNVDQDQNPDQDPYGDWVTFLVTFWNGGGGTAAVYPQSNVIPIKFNARWNHYIEELSIKCSSYVAFRSPPHIFFIGLPLRFTVTLYATFTWFITPSPSPNPRDNSTVVDPWPGRNTSGGPCNVAVSISSQ